MQPNTIILHGHIHRTGHVFDTHIQSVQSDTVLTLLIMQHDRLQNTPFIIIAYNDAEWGPLSNFTWHFEFAVLC